jgi:hypothetical protein
MTNYTNPTIMDYSIKMDTGKLWTLLKQTYNKSKK